MLIARRYNFPTSKLFVIYDKNGIRYDNKGSFRSKYEFKLYLTLNGLRISKINIDRAPNNKIGGYGILFNN